MISSPGRGRSIGLGGAAIRPCTGFQVFKIGEIQARKSPCSQLFNAIRPTASTAVCDPPFIFDLSLTVVRACSGLAETTGPQLAVRLAFVAQSLVRAVRCTAPDRHNAENHSPQTTRAIAGKYITHVVR